MLQAEANDSSERVEARRDGAGRGVECQTKKGSSNDSGGKCAVSWAGKHSFERVTVTFLCNQGNNGN